MFQAGLPSKQELLELPSDSVLVIDDLYSEACKADHMSYLFRVLSGKKRLHVFIMTQRYCAESGKGLNIRNSSNIHILMNNVNVRTNRAVCLSMGLKAEYEIAQKVNAKKLYPYILLDRSNEARVSGLQVYTDILSKYKQVILKQMVQYVISEADFLASYKIIDNDFAVQHEDKESTSSVPTKGTVKNKTNQIKVCDDSSFRKRKRTKLQQHRFKREVRRALQ